MDFVSKEDFVELGTEPLSTEPYCSAEYFEMEREKIFRQTWLFIARQEEVPNPGDYLVREFESCEASVLLLRGKDKQIRAFHNVCSHRSARVVWSERGNAPNFTCKYHGWGYGLKGELVTTPDANSFFDLDVRKCGLTPVHLDSWNGFYFVNFAETPKQSLAEFLAPIIPRLSEHPYELYDSVVEIGSVVDINWKCMVDNFSETYHLASIHNLSVGDRSIGEENPRGHPLKFEFHGPHRIMEVWGNPKHKPAAIEGLAAKHGGVISAGATQQTDRYKKTRHPNWQLDVHGLFPTVLVDVAPTFYFIHTFFPIAYNRTRWTTGLFFPKAKTAAQRFSQEYSVAAFRDTVTEDIAVLRQQQKGLASGAKKFFLFQKNEAMCRHNYLAVDAAVRGAPM